MDKNQNYADQTDDEPVEKEETSEESTMNSEDGWEEGYE
jgi:hypothetical protein